MDHCVLLVKPPVTHHLELPSDSKCPKMFFLTQIGQLYDQRLSMQPRINSIICFTTTNPVELRENRQRRFFPYNCNDIATSIQCCQMVILKYWDAWASSFKRASFRATSSHHKQMQFSEANIIGNTHETSSEMVSKKKRHKKFESLILRSEFLPRFHTYYIFVF